MTAQEIRDALEQSVFGQVLIPEFTFRGLRIDALVVDTRLRRARGFEIKLARSDFNRDEKWILYSEFCSSLSIATPEGLLTKADVPDPFGLVEIGPKRGYGTAGSVKWIKRPKKLQHRESLSWFWTYCGIIEAELPRLIHDNKWLRIRLEEYHRSIQELEKERDGLLAAIAEKQVAAP